MLYPSLVLTKIGGYVEVRINPAALTAYRVEPSENRKSVTRVYAGGLVFVVEETPEQIAAMVAELCRLQNQTVFNIPRMGLEELRALRSVGSAPGIVIVERPEGDKPDYGF